MRAPAALTRLWDRIRPHLRWPTPRDALFVLPVAVPLVAFSVFLVRGSRSADVPDYTAPPGVELPSGDPTTTAPAARYTDVVLPPVEGTTTTAPWPDAGTGRIAGVVTGPQGPVPGAVVHFERVVPGARTISFDTATGADGRYALDGAPGGRYRVRAYLPPNLAQTVPTTFFLAAGEQRETNLDVGQFSGMTVQVAVAPVPPIVNEPLELKVKVTNKQVDVDGVVRAMPVVGASVQLTATGTWAGLAPQPTATTGSSGEVTFGLTCRTAGPNSVVVAVRVNLVDPPVQESFDVGVCEPPPPSTTTTASTVPPPSGPTTSTPTTQPN